MLRAISDFISSLGYGLAIFMEREAGYQAMSLALIVFGVYISDGKARTEIAHDLIVFGLGVMARSMGTKKNAEVKP
jgi:hypothetical protein